jgi:hypothetical protein
MKDKSYKNKYGDGFNLILEDIINKYSTKPTKDKNYIKRMNIIFNGSSSIENINFIFNKYLTEINLKFKGKVRGVIIDCLKRLKRNKIL